MGDEKLRAFQKALLRLKEAYSESVKRRGSFEYPFFRDSAIQRFEFTVEIFWKSIKAFMKDQEGVTCGSPKSCIRELFSLGYLDEDQTRTLLEMIDSRNLTSHTYHEEVAEEIFGRLKSYIDTLELVAEKIAQRSE